MMDSPLVVSLVVSGIGLLVLFLTLALLYGLMVLMTILFKEPRVAPVTPVDDEAAELVLQAALVAVALARAEQEQRFDGAVDLEEPVSGWQAFHHQRQLMRNLRSRRHG